MLGWNGAGGPVELDAHFNLLLPPGGYLSSDWPAHAWGVVMGVSGIYPALLSASYLNVLQPGTVLPHLQYLALVKVPACSISCSS